MLFISHDELRSRNAETRFPQKEMQFYDLTSMQCVIRNCHLYDTSSKMGIVLYMNLLTSQIRFKICALPLPCHEL